MKDKKIIVFTTNNAIRMTNPHNFEEMALWPNAIVNPDLSALAGTPPHLWKKVGEEVQLLDELERLLRTRDIETHGADNVVRRIDAEKEKVFTQIQKKAAQAVQSYWRLPVAFLSGCLSMFLMMKGIHK